VTPDPGYTNWARWIDAHVERTPWPVAVAVWVGAYLCLLF
jgi:hypothetical protein